PNFQMDVGRLYGPRRQMARGPQADSITKNKGLKMATDRYGIYCASFTHAGGTLALQQLRRQQITAASRYRLIRPGGALTPAAHILATANPVIRFNTTDALTVLQTVSITDGLACTGGHVMRYQKRVPAGGLAGAGFVQTSSKG